MSWITEGFGVVGEQVVGEFDIQVEDLARLGSWISKAYVVLRHKYPPLQNSGLQPVNSG